MERLFFRERQEEKAPMHIDQLNIAVTGLGRSVGTTFVAAALAFFFRDMGKKVTFIQCLTPSRADSLLFDAVAMEQRFVRRAFNDIYQRIVLDQPIRGISNREEGINWLLPTPESCDLIDAQRARLVSAAKGEVCIFDLEVENQWDNHLMDMDLIVVVVDPLPSKLVRSKERFKFLKKLELSGCRVIWMVNRDNHGVNKRQVKAYLKTNHVIWIPKLPTEVIYQCEYACKFPWENAEIKRKMLEIFTKVSQFQ